MIQPSFDGFVTCAGESQPGLGMTTDYLHILKSVATETLLHLLNGP